MLFWKIPQERFAKSDRSYFLKRLKPLRLGAFTDGLRVCVSTRNKQQSEPDPEGPEPNVSPAREGWEAIRTCPSAVGAALDSYAGREPLKHMSHSYTNCYVHAVYSTKDRQNLIPEGFANRLYSFLASVARKHEIPFLAAGGMPNHSHLLFLLPATM
jgi:hypothetical protein